MASPQRLRETTLADASAPCFAVAADRRKAPCNAAKEEESIRSHMSEKLCLRCPLLCCMTSPHMAAPRVVVAHPVYLKATARGDFPTPLPAGSWQLPAHRTLSKQDKSESAIMPSLALIDAKK
mmetsp:Transcript_65265/g.173041  ORF Transcript_65265/g.173041 Transcript_65265/m.173041 type:complete len:123 (+) Transcript_65265:158-526(+)